MTVVILDDRNPAIMYSTGWVASGNPHAEYKGTTTFSVPGPNTSAVLTFVGTGVTVIGTLAANKKQISNYSIDGGAEVAFESPNVSEAFYSQTFFTTGEDKLAPGVQHRLKITPVQEILFIDMITYDVPVLGLAGTIQISATATATELCASRTVGYAAATATVTSCSSLSYDQGRTSSYIGPIVGGVLGGLALLGVLVLGIVYLRKSRKIDKERECTCMDSEPHQGKYDTLSNKKSPLISSYDNSIESMASSIGSSTRSNGSASSAETDIGEERI